MSKIGAAADDDAQKVQKNIRLPAPLIEEVREAAKRAKMSESAFVEVALEDYLRRQARVAVLPDELIQAVEEYLARQRR